MLFLLALCLFAGIFLRRQLLLPARFLFASVFLRCQLLLPARFLFAGLLLLCLLPLLVGTLLLHARAVPILLALLFLHVLPGLLLLLFGALLLHALLLRLGRGALACFVDGARVGAMRGSGGRVGVRCGPGRLLRGRVRLVLALVLVLVVARILLLLRRRRITGDGRAGESDRECDANDAGQGVLAQGLHGSHSGSRQRPHGRSRRRGCLTISENRRRRARRSARVKPRRPG